MFKLMMFALRCSNGKAIGLVALMIFLFGSSVSLQAQEQGEELFNKHCAVCHKISEEKLVGPGLKDVSERRDREWLMAFIESSKGMIKSGDKQALAVFEEYDKVDMPGFKHLKEDEIASIIDHIDTYKPEEKKAVPADYKKLEFTETDIERGQRMFMGLIEFENSTATCSSCHNIIDSDSLSWMPTVFDIAQKNDRMGGLYVFDVLNKPSSKVMKETHKDFTYTDEEMYYINAYLHHINEHGMEQAKKFPKDLMIFLGLGFLMALALIDLIWTKKVKFRIIHAGIIIVGLIVQLQIVSYEAINLSRTQDYQPDQPIKFSHKIHAGDNQIDCEYCHTTVDESKTAGIPSASVCMNCHQVVREGSKTGKFEIEKIYAALQSGDPIEWVKVHNLPDHVFFSHAQHVEVGGVACEECHGEVEEMDIVKQVEDLSMGWCINCHRETAVDFDENAYYDSYKKLHEDLKNGKLDSVTVENIGGLDCSNCHY